MAKKQEVLVMKNGDIFPILKKSGKYICVKGAQFRRANPNILEIKKVQQEETAPADETVLLDDTTQD